MATKPDKPQLNKDQKDAFRAIRKFIDHPSADTLQQIEFLFLEKSMYAMDHAELFRWWYTAVTRARKYLHLTKEWWIE